MRGVSPELSEYNHIYPHKRESEGIFWHTEEKAMWRQIRDAAQVKECQQPTEAGRDRDGFSSRALVGIAALPIPSLWILDPLNCEKISVVSRPPTLGWFVMAEQKTNGSTFHNACKSDFF